MQRVASEATVKFTPDQTGAIQEYSTIEKTNSPKTLVEIVEFILNTRTDE